MKLSAVVGHVDSQQNHDCRVLAKGIVLRNLTQNRKTSNKYNFREFKVQQLQENRITANNCSRSFFEQIPDLRSWKAKNCIQHSKLLFQVVLVTVTSTIWPPEPVKTMPMKMKPYLELSCSLKREGLVIPLSINILLVSLSMLFGFKTRKFPENFNESKCIFLCVCSTLLLLVAFLPTYFASFYAYHRSVLLSLCLVLNATVMLLCLFVPKVYALFYVDELICHFMTRLRSAMGWSPAEVSPEFREAYFSHEAHRENRPVSTRTQRSQSHVRHRVNRTMRLK